MSGCISRDTLNCVPMPERARAANREGKRPAVIDGEIVRQSYQRVGRYQKKICAENIPWQMVPMRSMSPGTLPAKGYRPYRRDRATLL